MNRYKKLGILAAALAVVCAATVLVIHHEERKEQIKNSDEVVLEIAPDTVSALSWKYEGETLSFHRDGKWLYDDDKAFPVDEEKINQRLELFEAFGAAFIIEDVENYSQYGLAQPLCTIALTAGDSTYEINLGDYSKMDSQRYVSIGDGNVYLVKNDPLDFFDAVLQDMIEDDKTPVWDQVQEIQFSGDAAYAIQYQEDGGSSYREDDTWFVQGSGLPLDPRRVEDYLQTVRYLDLSDYSTYNATQEELESYGLDAPELTLRVDYTFENDEKKEVQDVFVLHISRDPEERKETDKTAESSEDAEDDTITAYARVGDSQIVYRLASGEYTSLMGASYDDLRHREITPADLENISRVDVTLEGRNYTITAQKDGDEQKWYYMDEEIESGDFQTALAGLEADSFTGETPTQKEEISLVVYLDLEDDPTVSVKLYRYDGSDCLAVVDGESVALVPRADVVDLMEAVNAIVLR